MKRLGKGAPVLLAKVYKTWTGADKRARFENLFQPKERKYHYYVVKLLDDNQLVHMLDAAREGVYTYRVARKLRELPWEG